MVKHIEQTKRYNVSASKVWAALADFGNVNKWHFSVENSPMIDGTSFGLGAKRTCNFYDGSSVVEEIVEFHEGEKFIVEITEFSMPLKSLIAATKVRALDDTTCDITIEMDFVVKGGPFGVVMGALMVKPMMRKVAKKLLDGLAYHAATENVVGNEMPSDRDLPLAFG
ncbi:MAG: ribosome-associated toxin RatA of RatAB toxin-antitoxin module [Paracoccaceae bacterium]|jgi:ribosome-associated toxin RatA of RatAB toxin-antitoxin module